MAVGRPHATRRLYPHHRMAISEKRRRNLLRMVFGNRNAYPLTDAPGDPERMICNGVKITQGVVNVWLQREWCMLRMRQPGGSELALTPLGASVVEAPIEEVRRA